jgi:hypothetical protein
VEDSPFNPSVTGFPDNQGTPIRVSAIP